MIKNIIFDFDGVIADSEILVAKAFSKYLESQNIDFSEKEFSIYQFNRSKYIIEIFDSSYLKTLSDLNIKFDNVSQISNFTYKRNKKNKIVYKYDQNELVSVIRYD